MSDGWLAVAAWVGEIIGTFVLWNTGDQALPSNLLLLAYIAINTALFLIAGRAVSAWRRGFAAGTATGIAAAIVLVGILGAGPALVPALVLWAILLVRTARAATDFDLKTAVTATMAGFGVALVLASVVVMAA